MWLPPEHELEAWVNAEADRFADRARCLEMVREFNSELRRIDRGLELVWIATPSNWPEDADPPLGIVFDRWHVVKDNGSRAQDYMPILGVDGSYREPDSRVFEQLKASDMFNDANRARARKRQAQAAADRQRKRDQLRGEVRQEFMERLQSASRVSVSVPRDI